jgi:predicted DCC family thiol-disulfide oxidoreductase YuxK
MPPYSHRRDDTVPEFSDQGSIVFMDGNCAMCSRSSRIIARLDRRDEFLICTTQSPLGQAVLRHYGLEPANPDSWLYLESGLPYTSLDAIARVGVRLGGLARLLGVLSWPPRSVQDWFYSLIARNRYRIMGQADLCALPDARVRKRLIG